MKEERQKREQEPIKEQKQLPSAEQGEYTLLGAAQKEEDIVNGGAESIERLKSYTYFNSKLIQKSVTIGQDAWKKGAAIFKQGNVTVKSVQTAFEQRSSEIVGIAEGLGRTGKEEFSIRLVFSRDRVREWRCACPKCRRNPEYWFVPKTTCPYRAAFLMAIEQILSKENVADATDYGAYAFLRFFQLRHAENIVSSTDSGKEGPLTLQPRLIRKGGELSVSFRIGEGRLFVVKKLDEFTEQIRDSAVGVYGSNTKIHHDINRFSERGKAWIQYINRIVQEEQRFRERMLESRYYYANYVAGVGSSLKLFGWRLDEFYHMLEAEAIEFEDKDAAEKKKGMLSAKEGNPQLTLHISPETFYKNNEFHGIRVSGKIPELYEGTEHAYYVQGDGMYKTTPEFLQKTEPFAKMSEDGRFSFLVGRNHMAEFYYQVLPQLKELVELEEHDAGLIRSFLPPDVRFYFYLDMEDNDAVCRIVSEYGTQKFSVLDVLNDDEEAVLEPFRNRGREEEILLLACEWFPEVDWERQELHSDGDEGRLYGLLEQGLESLMAVGEVHCTKQFMQIRKIRPVKVAVGVSVSSGMLDLDITTEDVSGQELLEILKSYRLKKKYFRMKDGSFVNMQEPSLAMLAEMQEAMQLKNSELLKEKLKLPMYRTLYLDQMLEKNEGVYSERDTAFRQIIKGFKTVKDSDFEEPRSLSRVMRNYQKIGYKWLRTVEAWKFGGILADDMGLGKTLQMISVLLAARLEKREGTSLIVCPASLVYNWGEEFKRFAPELKVSLIAGTQKERQELMKEPADVWVTSYDLLKRDIARYEDKEFLYEVLDEAQYIKNHTTAAAKAVKVIRSSHRFALTGTPIENRLSELWSIFDYLMPGFLYSYETFRKELELPIAKNKDEDALKRLQRMVSPFILRRLKGDVLKDLPDKLEETRYVQLSGEQKTVYDGQVVEIKELLKGQNDEDFSKNKLQVLAFLTRLRQICCDPHLCLENYKGETAKTEACVDLIQSAIDGGHHILVFSQFTSMLEILQKRLDKAGIAYYTITGATEKGKRIQLVQSFNRGSVPVFLISLKAGGVGLNLTGADVVIHYDPWWNLAAQNQATDRAHRIGQTKKVTVYKLIARNTIEEKIQALQETKRDLADQIVNTETGQISNMTKEDLLALL